MATVALCGVMGHNSITTTPHVDKRDKFRAIYGSGERKVGEETVSGERRKERSHMMASTRRSKRGEVQPKISPGDRGRHWGTSTS